MGSSGIGIGPRSISIVLLLYYLVIPRRRDIILAFRTAPREPQRILALVTEHGTSGGRTKALRPNDIIQSTRNETIIQTSGTTTKHRGGTRCGYFFTTTTILWQYSNVGNQIFLL